jgi:hypothetical protein
MCTSKSTDEQRRLVRVDDVRTQRKRRVVSLNEYSSAPSGHANHTRHDSCGQFASRMTIAPELWSEVRASQAIEHGEPVPLPRASSSVSRSDNVVHAYLERFCAANETTVKSQFVKFHHLTKVLLANTVRRDSR